MRSDVEKMLREIAETYADKLEWLVLGTGTGEYVGHWGTVETDRVVALLGAADGHHNRIATEIGLGEIHYGITWGKNGFLLTVFAVDPWVLGMKFTSHTLMDALRILPEVLVRLVELPDDEK